MRAPLITFRVLVPPLNDLEIASTYIFSYNQGPFPERKYNG